LLRGNISFNVAPRNGMKNALEITGSGTCRLNANPSSVIS